MFKRFLNATRRTPAAEDQATHAHNACNHADPAARRDACRRIRDPSLLLRIAVEDADAGVREIALGRCRNLLCGVEDPAVPCEQCLAALTELRDPRVIEHVATQAREAQVRQAAIARVGSQLILATCAIHDTLAANRAVAAALLQDRQALEQVARQVAKRDKNVYRLVRQKLKLIQEAEALPRQSRALCEELCEKLARLGRFDTWSQDLALLAHFDRQWAEMEPHADGASRERYAGLRTRLLAAYDAYRDANAAQVAAAEARAALRLERRALLDALVDAATMDDEAAIAAACTQIGARWEALACLPESEQAILDRDYAALNTTAQQHRDDLRAQRRGNERLAKLNQAATQLLAQANPLEYKDVERLLEQAQPILAITGITRPLTDDFAQVRSALDARLRKQHKHAAQRLLDLPEHLAELEAHLTAGELKSAEPLLQSLQAAVDLAQASGLPRGDYGHLADRLHALAPRVRELQQWRKWGTDQHRQGLQESMEELATADLPMEAVTLRLHDLQMEWKGLDQSGSPVNHALWDRFHAASERVYERCRPYFEEQARIQEANAAQREQVCQDLETFLEQVDWARVDWKKAVRAERETRQAWAAQGPVDPRRRRALEKRFHAAMDRLDAHLEEERARNRKLKQDLIMQVEALASEPDIERACEQTKRLQRDWHTSVAARQRDENRLWTRFRAACDAVFARRREQHDAQGAEFAANLATREAICAEAQALAGSGDEAQALAAGLREIEARWREAESLPVPRQALGALQQHWREAREACESAHQGRLEALERAQEQRLTRLVWLCEGLEQALLTPGAEPPEPDTLEGDWQAQGRLRDTVLQKALDRRFGQALAAARTGGKALADLAAACEPNARRRGDLCLQLEVMAQVESPPELAKERMELQVARLSGHMGGSERGPVAAAPNLLREWYLCGPAPTDPALMARFERARMALGRGADSAALG
jgi:DNA repair protein SbcC/Rad50